MAANGATSASTIRVGPVNAGQMALQRIAAGRNSTDNASVIRMTAALLML
jgi:hypothetical protein